LAKDKERDGSRSRTLTTNAARGLEVGQRLLICWMDAIGSSGLPCAGEELDLTDRVENLDLRLLSSE
jgi:hypothetical protein